MATIEENSKKMTIFYMKSDGAIVNFCTGIADMNFYGTHEEDYSQIYDFIVIDYDEYIMNNLFNFYVDIEEKRVKLIQTQDLSKYM